MPKSIEEKRADKRAYQREYHKTHKRNGVKEQNAKFRKNNPEYGHEYFKKHSKKYRVYCKTNQQKTIDWYKEYKSTLSCNRCPESDAACLVFHHPGDDKTETVSQMVGHNRSKALILEEIAKCEVLCANCHRKLHRDIRDGIV